MSAMKQWPKNGGTLDLRDIVDPLIDAFEQCYACTRKNETVDFVYKGYDFGPAEKASGASPAGALKAANFASSEETPLRAILSVAVKLGMEQGRRMQLERSLLLSEFNNLAAPAAGSLRSWPADSRETVSFEELTAPLVKATHHYYRLKRKNAGKDVDYKGYNVGGSTLACCPPPDETLTVDGLDYHKERGRSPVDVIIGIAVQIGIEQGQRLLEKDPQIIALKKQQADEMAAAKKAWDAMPPEVKKARLEQLAKILKPK